MRGVDVLRVCSYVLCTFVYNIHICACVHILTVEVISQSGEYDKGMQCVWMMLSM